MCVYGFSDTSLGLSFSVGFSVWSLFLQQILHLFRYCFTFFITLSHQKFLVISSIIFYCSLCSIISMLQCKKIISVLNLSFFGTYISELKKMDLVFILSFIFILFLFYFPFFGLRVRVRVISHTVISVTIIVTLLHSTEERSRRF